MSNTLELRVARKLVEKAIASGFVVSVYDGGEWTVKKSANVKEIVGALASVDEDTLRFRDKETGIVIGSAFLVWGNAPDGSELIADYSVNPAMETLMTGIG